MTVATAMKTALDNASVIRRPLVVRGNDIWLGFDDEQFKKIAAK